MSIIEFDRPLYWSLDASETGESTKYPWVEVGGGGNGGLLTPPPLPTGILYSPKFRSHQETKILAGRTQLSTSTISRENRGL